MEPTTLPARTGQGTAGEKPVRRLVVPLDGTDNAERVLPYVQFMARWMKAETTLLHVLFRPQRPQSGPDSVVYPDTLHDRAHSLATAYLSEVTRKLMETGMNPRTVVVAGDPVRVIAAHAAHDPYEMIAMGTNARSLLSRMWRESIFERLMMTTRVPVFAVNAHLNRSKYNVPPEPRGLLVALDGSGVARRSIPYAIALAKAGSLKVTLLHVFKSRKKHAEFSRDGTAPVGDAASVNRRLEAVSNLFTEAGVPVETQVRHGPTAETIVEVQNELGAHIAVIASRVRRGLRRAIFGSVLDRTIRIASDPLLVVPVRGWRQRGRVPADGVPTWSGG